MSRPVTDDELVAFLRGFLADNDNFPNAPTIAHRFGWASINAAYERMLKLERRGVIERNAVGGWRFKRPLEVLRQAERAARRNEPGYYSPENLARLMRSPEEVRESQRKLGALLFGGTGGDEP